MREPDSYNVTVTFSVSRDFAPTPQEAADVVMEELHSSMRGGYSKELVSVAPVFYDEEYVETVGDPIPL